MKLLTICPSRGRPEMLKAMIKSYHETKTVDAQMVVYVSNDDPLLSVYVDLVDNVDAWFIFGQRRSLGKVLNHVSCERYPNVEYYQEINDDHLFMTYGWDKAFINAIEKRGKGWGIACGNDLLGNEPWEVCRHPSGAIVSGNIIRTLGCFIWPDFDTLFVDTYLRDIADGIGRYYHFTDIIVKHCHWLNGCRPKDANYDAVYADAIYKKFTPLYHRWVKYYKADDIQKLKEAMNGGL